MVTKLFDDEEGRNWFKSVMHEETVTVTFEKKEGTERVMRCTLNENKIPGEKMPSGESKKQKNDEVQPVFDLDVGEWRSFRWDSVKKIEFTLGE